MENKNKEVSQKLAEKINMANMEKKQTPQQTQDSVLKWDPTSTFIINGNEFGTLVNTLKQVTESKYFLDKLMEARNTIAIASLQELIQKKLESFTQQGLVRKLTKEEFDNENRREIEAIENKKREKIPEESLEVEG